MRELVLALTCALLFAACGEKPAKPAASHESAAAADDVEGCTAVFPERIMAAFPEFIESAPPSVEESAYERMVAGVAAIDEWFKTTNQTDATLAAAVGSAGFESFEELDALAARLMDIVEVRDGLLMIEKELGNPDVAPMLRGDEPMTALFPIRLKAALDLVREALPARGYTLGDLELAEKYESEIRRARHHNHPIASIRRIRGGR